MPFIKYVDKRFGPSAQAIILDANTIINQYQAQGYTLTLRQLYYQVVSRALIPNQQKEYTRLGDIISDARLAGLIDWEAITDLTREHVQNSHWDSPRDIVATCAKQYQIDKWEDQPNHVEVWIEKDALSGVFEPVCRGLDVSFFSCRGYTSQSAMWEAGRRLRDRAAEGKDIHILHFGDHDPSGLDMTRDIRDRLELFMEDDAYVLTVDRVALTMAQIQQYNPPPNPAKVTDSRATAYIQQHGIQSWELDALDPRTLSALVTTNVDILRDDSLFNAAKAKEQKHRKAILDILPKLPK